MSGRRSLRVRSVAGRVNDLRQATLAIVASGLSRLLGMAAIGLSGLLGMAAASADPASSADSAWWPLPSERDAELSDPLEQRGREVFDQRCAACHGEIPDETFGPSFLPPMPGTQALRTLYRGALPAELERRANLTPEYIEAVVREGLRSMPFFRPTEVSAEDLEALTAYLTRDEDTGTAAPTDP